MDEVHRGAIPSSFGKEKLDDELNYIKLMLLFADSFLKGFIYS